MTLLNLPDIRQESDHDCAECAAKIVLRFFGIREYPAFSTPTDGADPRQIESALRLSGLCVASGEMKIEDVRHYCSTGRPVICLVKTEGVGHYVVARGVTSKRVYYQDPFCGGKFKTIPTWTTWWFDDTTRWGAGFWNFGLAAWKGT